MEEGSNQTGLSLREATPNDIPQLCVHHRKMFAEIWQAKGQRIESSIGSAIERAYSLKLSAELSAGSCKSWLIENGAKAIASGAISIASLEPGPNDLSS